MPQALVLIVGMVLLGWLFRQLKLLPDASADVLNALVLKLCFPALVLSVLPKLSLSAAVLKIALIAWIVMALSALVIHLIARAQRYKPDVEGCLLLTAVLGNTAFLGYPLTQAYLGSEHLPQAVIYDQLGSFLIFSTFGLWVAAHFSGGKSPTAAQTMQKIITFPAFMALIVGLALSYTSTALPDWLASLIASIGALLVPLAMFAVGLNFRLRGAPGFGMPLLIGLSCKMLLAPLIALGLAAFILPKDAHALVVLQASMPPMATAAALAASAGLRADLAAAMAGFGVLLAMLWTPILLSLMPGY